MGYPDTLRFAQTRSKAPYGATNAYQNITGEGDGDAAAIAALERKIPGKLKQLNARISVLEQDLAELKMVRDELMSPTNLV